MTGIERIAAERQRQIEEEGWTAEHDEQHEKGELAAVAALYAIEATRLLDEQAGQAVWEWLYPKWWDVEWWKPGESDHDPESPTTDADRIRCLEKAGALIAAEIDRRLRLKNEEREG